ncbi:MAG TPA: Ig-like domain-containing protein [Gemmatimonadales bacterium]|nr:Ig-like domain-containing protein [Gemmatimonadales bacterium]
MPRTPAALVATALFLAGCSERERLVFEEPGGGGSGGGDRDPPVTTIESPAQDTTVSEASGSVFVTGRVTDAGGLDTVYFDIAGGATRFTPLVGGGDDTVRFALPITTDDQSGQTIDVSIYGVDMAGNRGSAVSRRLIVQ